MPRASLSVQQIRHELAWVAKDLTRRGWLSRYAMRKRARAFRRHVHRGTHDKPMDVSLGVLLECREYQWNRSKALVGTTIC